MFFFKPQKFKSNVLVKKNALVLPPRVLLARNNYHYPCLLSLTPGYYCNLGQYTNKIINNDKFIWYALNSARPSFLLKNIKTIAPINDNTQRHSSEISIRNNIGRARTADNSHTLNWLLLQFLVNSPTTLNSPSALGLMYASSLDLCRFSHFNFNLSFTRLTQEFLKYPFWPSTYFTSLQTMLPSLTNINAPAPTSRNSDINNNTTPPLSLHKLKYLKKTIFEKNNIWKKQYLKKSLGATAFFFTNGNTALTKLHLRTKQKRHPKIQRFLVSHRFLSSCFQSHANTLSRSKMISNPMLQQQIFSGEFSFLQTNILLFTTKSTVIDPTVKFINRVCENLPPQVSIPQITSLLPNNTFFLKKQFSTIFYRHPLRTLEKLYTSILAPLFLLCYFPFFWKLMSITKPQANSLCLPHLNYIYYTQYATALSTVTRSTQSTNLIPILTLNKYFIKQISSPSYLNYFIEGSIITWTYNFFVRFLEFCTGKKILLQIYSFINQNVSLEFATLYKKWIPRMGFYEKRLGHKFFFEESLHILHLGFTLRDARLLSTWLKSLIQRISFWKTRLIFRFLKYLFQNYFMYLFPKLGLQGFKIKLKGKISAAGNSRKRTILYRKGRTSHSTVNLRTVHEFRTITTFTGVMGLQIWVFY